jgi:hypothetical protein
VIPVHIAVTSFAAAGVQAARAASLAIITAAKAVDVNNPARSALLRHFI